MTENKTFIRKSNKFYISPQGKVKGLHCDVLDKLRLKLGTSTVERASSVEFDNEKQQWVATIFENGKTFYADSREEVLNLEKEEINRLITDRTKCQITHF
jgi:hypothetical protein